MGTTIEKGATLGRFPLTKVRDFLLALCDHPANDEGIASLKRLGLSLPSVLALRSHAYSAGLLHSIGDRHSIDFSRNHPFLTDDGCAVAFASARPRMPAEKAWRLLEEILDRCVANNADPERVGDVTDVWLFGSLAKGKDDVGDIDVVIETSTRKDLRERFREMTTDEMWEFGSAHLPDHVVSRIVSRYPPVMLYEILDRRILGPRRNPVIARNDLHTLVDMHEPCMHLFSRSGGRLPRRLLPHHPESATRSGRFDAPRTMPDLDLESLPAPISWEGLTLCDAPSTDLHDPSTPFEMQWASPTYQSLLRRWDPNHDIREDRRLRRILPAPSGGDLILLSSRIGGRRSIHGVAKVRQEWTSEDDAAVSTIDLSIVGCRRLPEWHRANVMSHLALVCATCATLGRDLSSSPRTTVRFRGNDAMSARVVRDLSRILREYPRWAVDGDIRFPDADRPDLDPFLADGLFLEFSPEGTVETAMAPSAYLPRREYVPEGIRQTRTGVGF